MSICIYLLIIDLSATIMMSINIGCFSIWGYRKHSNILFISFFHKMNDVFFFVLFWHAWRPGRQGPPVHASNMFNGNKIISYIFKVLSYMSKFVLNFNQCWCLFYFSIHYFKIPNLRWRWSIRPINPHPSPELLSLLKPFKYLLPLF